MRKKSWYLPIYCLLILLLAGCSKQLESGLSEDDAQLIVVLLRENNINASVAPDPAAKKDAPTWIVTVRGRNDTTIRAWKLLEENGLPRARVKGLDSVFADAGIIPTASQEKARLISGLDGELTRMLESLPGVMDAKVQVVLPEVTPLLEKSEQPQPTASALIQYRSASPPLDESQVKNLLARSIEGLAPQNVVVVYKKVEVQPIPVQRLGPLSLSTWLEIAAVALAIVAGLTSLLLVSVSKVRKQKISALEKQLAELRAGGVSKNLAPGKA